MTKKSKKVVLKRTGLNPRDVLRERGIDLDAPANADFRRLVEALFSIPAEHRESALELARLLPVFRTLFALMNRDRSQAYPLAVEALVHEEYRTKHDGLLAAAAAKAIGVPRLIELEDAARELPGFADKARRFNAKEPAAALTAATTMLAKLPAAQPPKRDAGRPKGSKDSRPRIRGR